MKKNTKSFEWKLSEHELKLLSNAKKKYFLASINLIKKCSIEQKFFISLRYTDLNTSLEVTGSFVLTIFPDVEAGIPFKIIIPDILPIGSVKYKESYGLSNELHLKQGNKEFLINRHSVTYFNANFPSKPQILEGIFSNFKSAKKESNKLYRRVIIPVKDTDMIYPTSILEYDENHMKFDIENWDRQSSLMGLSFMSTKGMFSLLKINEFNFQFYALEHIKSYIIDCNEKISNKEFKRITSIIRICMAFLCGKYYRGETIYLSAKDTDFTKLVNFERLFEASSTLSENKIINPHFFFDHYEKQDTDTQASLKEHHKMFPTDVFESLCEKCIKSPEILRTIELIVRASSIDDPVQKGALYSVAIEALTEYLVSETPEPFKPISNKAEAKKLISSLMAVLDASKSTIDINGYTILSKKIANINSPTNRDKLEKPFELAKIELLPDDLEALDKRNDYLHGREPLEGGTRYDLEQIALHLHTLISHLILKHIGYSGHLINLPSWNLLHNKDVADNANIDPAEIVKVLKQVNDESFNSIEEITYAKEVLLKYREILKIEKLIKGIIRIV